MYGMGSMEEMNLAQKSPIGAQSACTDHGAHVLSNKDAESEFAKLLRDKQEKEKEGV